MWRFGMKIVAVCSIGLALAVDPVAAAWLGLTWFGFALIAHWTPDDEEEWS